MKLLTRQKIILRLIDLLGGDVSRLRLVKLCFLLRMKTQSSGGKTFFDFLPYHFGPYSFTLYFEISKMIRNGLLEERGKREWGLSSSSIDLHGGLEEQLDLDLRTVLGEYGDLDTAELVDLTYEEFPWYTANSRNKRKRRAAVPVAKPMVYTIGYEGLSVDSFLNTLLRNGIANLLDVRSNPIARRFGYHKSTLKRLCGYVEISYTHVPQLGISSSARQDISMPGVREDILSHYEQTVIPAKRALIEEIGRKVVIAPSALMCLERNPLSCHRHHLATELSRQTKLETQHIVCTDHQPNTRALAS